MKVHEMRDAYYEASGKVSDISRQLAFAGIAVIWVLKVGSKSGGIPFSTELVIPLYCFVAALGFDLLQYVYKSIVWAALNYYHWDRCKDNQAEIEVSEKVNWPTNAFFWGKVIAICYGYVELLFFIHSKL